MEPAVSGGSPDLPSPSFKHQAEDARYERHRSQEATFRIAAGGAALWSQVHGCEDVLRSQLRMRLGLLPSFRRWSAWVCLLGMARPCPQRTCEQDAEGLVMPRLTVFMFGAACGAWLNMWPSLIDPRCSFGFAYLLSFVALVAIARSLAAPNVGRPI